MQYFISVSIFLLLHFIVQSQGVGINSGGNTPDNSALLDLNASPGNDKGFLLPRLTTSEMNAISSPATGLMVYNTDCNSINYWNGGAWVAMGNAGSVSTPGGITGSTTPCENATGVSYSISVVSGATGYNWTMPTGGSVASGQGSTSISGNFATTNGNVCVTAFNACGTSNASCATITLSSAPSAGPTEGTHTPTQTQITWNWNAVAGATGYKYNTVNNYGTATDNGASTSYVQTSLTCGTAYNLYVWAYNSCGNSSSTTLSESTTSCCSDTWTQKANFGGVARSGAIGFAIGTKGYMGTGGNGSCFTDFWEYDPSTDIWTQKANYIGLTTVRQLTAFAVGTKGYVGLSTTACSNSNGTTNFYQWDQATNTWSAIANFGGSARWSAAAFSIGTKGYVGTGYYTTSSPYVTNDFWEYDTGTDTWTQKANFGGVRRNTASAFAISGKGYIGLGWNNLGTYYNDFWEYDPGTNAWTQKANFGGAVRGYATGFSIGTKGYFGCGLNGGTKYNDFWEYDPGADSWTQKANFGGAARHAPASFAVGGKGYIGTGNTTVATQDFWEYCP